MILALTNPVPEIEPQVALEAGAAFAADGTSVNDVSGTRNLPRSAARRRLADQRRDEAGRRLGTGRADGTAELVPEVLDRHVHDTVAEAVRQAAIDSGVADPSRIMPVL